MCVLCNNNNNIVCACVHCSRLCDQRSSIRGKKAPADRIRDPWEYLYYSTYIHIYIYSYICILCIPPPPTTSVRDRTRYYYNNITCSAATYTPTRRARPLIIVGARARAYNTPNNIIIIYLSSTRERTRVGVISPVLSALHRSHNTTPCPAEYTTT